MSQWQRNARHWDLIGPPLRPSPEDIRFLASVVHRRAGNPGTTGTALLYGVTREIAALDWPADLRLVALDNSEAMIARVWQPPTAIESHALCADWRRLPLADACSDLILGDGSLSLLPYPHDYRVAAREIRRVLRPHGRVVFRLFTRPAEPESLDAIFDHLTAGRIGSFHAFKWRLAMAVHGTSEEGVLLSEVWDAWHDAVPDGDQLAAARRWPPAAVGTIDAYRDSTTHYWFPTLDEVRSALGQDLRETAIRFPGYELGERCPTLVLVPGGEQT